ncbi:MAG: pirin family protein [Burkholderiaceae bacterium]|nr:pirin family protein [Burkholderiaceae bacterium]
MSRPPSAILQPAPVQRPRDVEQIVAGVATSDGAGVKLTRVLHQPMQQRLDPFLMLDAFGSDRPGDYIAGFPDHPHRGFEAITYMIAGRMRHRDSAGHEGLLEGGGAQWMVAGRGLIHSELPEQTEGVMEGFQLWLNLPATDKLCDPWYRDIPASRIPAYTIDGGVQVRVIAGHSNGIDGAMQRPRTEPLYLDIALPPGTIFTQTLPPQHNALIYVFRQSVGIGASQVPAQRMAVLTNDPASDGVQLHALAGNSGPARVLLIAGHPLREPIAQHGPFVMNTREQLVQAVNDFHSGKFDASPALK